jgi:hypothetical protein
MSCTVSSQVRSHPALHAIFRSAAPPGGGPKWRPRERNIGKGISNMTYGSTATNRSESTTWS